MYLTLQTSNTEALFKLKPLFLDYIPGSGEAVGTKIASSPVTSDQ